MATNFWICYESKCHYKGPTKEFKRPRQAYECPKCKGEDVFPWRKFRCLGCGFEEEQGRFFATKVGVGKYNDMDLDQDPMKKPRLQYECWQANSDLCDSTEYEQIDESTDPPKQMLFELRREQQADGSWLFEAELDKKSLARSTIDAAHCPLGTRLAVMEKQFGREQIVAEVKLVQYSALLRMFYGDVALLEEPEDVKKGKGYSFTIDASNEKFEEYDPMIPLFVTRQDDTSCQEWLKRILKKERKKKR